MFYKSYTCLNDMNAEHCADKYFVVKGAGRTLDGLEVKVSGLTEDDALAEISVIRRNGVLIGDRMWQEAVPAGTLFLSKKVLFLSQFQDEMEFSSKNDYGKYLSETSNSRGTVKVTHVDYENALSVNVYDLSVTPNKTLFSRVFFGKSKEAAETALLHFLLPAKDPESIVHDLRKVQ